jgi:glycosyltransferase involved in cell wall biosynthesis
MKNKILIIRHKNFSNTDVSIKEQLVKSFPEYEIHTFNTHEIFVKISKLTLFLNSFYFLREYGLDYIKGQKVFRNFKAFYKQTSLFHKIYKKHLAAHMKNNNYIFTFQLQSLFDGHTKGTPHFVYTDHIALANFTYPDINPYHYLRSQACIKEEKSLYQNSDLCFTMSNNISKLLTDKYQVPAENVCCVYAGSNIEVRYEENIEKYASKNILFVGIAWERKGGPILIKAFEKVLQKVPDAQLTIVGCVPDIKGPNITIAGKVSPEQLPSYFNRASVFCMPTLLEPFGIVFVEAMNYRLPVVSKNIGALGDMVVNGFNGYLINNDVDGYAEVLTNLLLNPQLCENMGKNGYNLAKDRYTWDNVGKKIQENIMQVLKIAEKNVRKN